MIVHVESGLTNEHLLELLDKNSAVISKWVVNVT